jgi:chaperone modulatory protein CbpM
MTNEETLPQLTGIILEEQTQLTLAEISRGCAVHAECIIELVEEGVLAPIGDDPRQWRFSGMHLRRATIALRLQHDLGVNLAGAALALQLLDEVNSLRARLSKAGGE